MAEEKKVVTLDDFEQRLMVSGLMDFRNDLLKDDKPLSDKCKLLHTPLNVRSGNENLSKRKPIVRYLSMR